jgi:hypothetical protein
MKRLWAIAALILFLASIASGQASSQAPAPGSISLPVLQGVDVTVLVENMAGDPSLLG